MKTRCLLVVMTLGVAGSDNAALASRDTSRQMLPQALGTERAVTALESPRGERVASTENAISSSDYFQCFQAGDCTAPALSNSTSCHKGRDYDISLSNKGSDVVVLSFHGGHIEPGSSELASALAGRFNWNHYDFAGHGSDDCLGKLSNFERLHITSTNFDDPDAVNLIKGMRKAVAIHGYKEDRENPRGTICVGGGNSAQITEFISAVGKTRAGFSLYPLVVVNAAEGEKVAGSDCSALQGTSSSNPVNLVAGDRGGLQLEMSRGIKLDLVDPDTRFDALRSIIYDAISSAMNK